MNRLLRSLRKKSCGTGTLGCARGTGTPAGAEFVAPCWRIPTLQRLLAQALRVAGLALIAALVLGAGTLLAQNSSKKAGGANAAAVARGKTLFQQKCSICHYDTSDQKKIGPGLKGISKRGTFSVNGNKINDETLKNWIENGDNLMPPFKEVLEPAQVKDVIAYVKTL